MIKSRPSTQEHEYIRAAEGLAPEAKWGIFVQGSSAYSLSDLPTALLSISETASTPDWFRVAVASLPHFRWSTLPCTRSSFLQVAVLSVWIPGVVRWMCRDSDSKGAMGVRLVYGSELECYLEYDSIV